MTMIEIGQFRVTIPTVQEWESFPYSSPPPEGIASADTFYTNANGSKVVFYLTPGNHTRLWTDMDLFAKLESSSLWQQLLARDYVQLGRYRAIRVLSTIGSAVQVQYFFEADPATLLVAGCTFGRGELVSASRFDSLFSGFQID